MSTGKLFENVGNAVTRADYGNGYIFFGFDLSPDLCPDDGHFNSVRKGHLRLEVHFTAALPQTVNVVVYGEFKTVLEIDTNRNVVYDY